MCGVFKGIVGVFGKEGGYLFACGVRFCLSFTVLKSCTASLVLLAFRPMGLKLAHGSGFQSLTQAKQFACLLAQKTTLSGGFKWCPRDWPQVASLTFGTRGPASSYSPFGLWPQTRIRLRRSIPNAGKAVCKYIQMGENIFQTKNRLF